MKTLQARSSGPLQPGHRIPDLGLASASSAGMAVLKRRRISKVVVVVHSASCPGCISYLDGLKSVEEQLRGWDAVPLVLIPGADTNQSELEKRFAGSFVILTDPGRTWMAAAEIDDATLLVCDQWEELHVVEAAGTTHRFIEPGEVVQWGKFLATKCPECEGEAL